MVSTRAKSHFLSASPFFHQVFGRWCAISQQYLAGATETLIEEELEGEELWSAKDIKIPVYNTEDGAFNGFLVIYAD